MLEDYAASAAQTEEVVQAYGDFYFPRMPWALVSD